MKQRILVLLSFLCMVYTGVWAQDEVAQIGNTKYATLQSAVDAATAGQTIQLINDIQRSAADMIANEADINKAVTIDFNGHNIYGCYQYGALVIRNAVKITDSSENPGTISNTNNNECSTDCGTIYVDNNGNVIYDKVGINCSQTAIYNKGCFRLNSGKLLSSGAGIKVLSNSTTYIMDGEITATKAALCTVEDATGASVYMRGGKLTSNDNAVIDLSGSMTNGKNYIIINEGTITGYTATEENVACGIYVPYNDVVSIYNPEINITDGCGILPCGGNVTIWPYDKNHETTKISINCTGDRTGKVGQTEGVPCSAIAFDPEKAPDYAAVNIANGFFHTNHGIPAITEVWRGEGHKHHFHVSGGRFSHEVAPEYCLKGHGCKKNNDESYDVTKAEEVTDNTTYTIDGTNASEIASDAANKIAVVSALDNVNVNTKVNDVAENVTSGVIPADAKSSYIQVQLTSATTTTETTTDSKTVVNKMTFDVTPVYVSSDGVITTISNDDITSPITFRLPVDANVTETAVAVSHILEDGTTEDLGYVLIQGDETNGKYIELSATSFSTYSYVLTDEAEGITAYYYDQTTQAGTYKNILTTDWTDFQAQYPNAIGLTKTTSGIAFATDKTDGEYTYSNIVVESTDALGDHTYACPNFVLTDLKDFYYPTDFTAKNVTYIRSTIGQYNTVCLPFEFTSEDVNNGSIQIFNSYNEETSQLNFIKVSSVEAGVGCIVKCDDTDTGWNMSLTNKVIKATPNSTSAMTGSYVYNPNLGAGYYKLNTTGTKFGKTSEEGKAYAFRSYIDISANSEYAMAAKSLNVVWDSEDDNTATSISSTSFDADGIEEIYSANGTKLNGLSRGLNIIKMKDGSIRKVVIK